MGWPRAGMILGVVMALLSSGAPVQGATPAIHLERGPADEHGCRSLQLWNGDRLVRTFAAAWDSLFATDCSRQVKRARLGELLFFDWWDPTTASSFAVTSTGTLWATDGTDAGTLAVAALSSYEDSMYCENHSEWLRSGDAVFVHQPRTGASHCGSYGQGELWGTRGLRQVALLATEVHGLQPFRHGVLMIGHHWRTGVEVRASNGTIGGTGVLRDIAPGKDSSEPSLLDRIGARFLFTADDRTHGRELWVTDGTWRGTHLVKDIRPGRRGAGFEVFDESPPRLPSAHFRDRVYFVANDGVHGSELWVTDGTGHGTHLVKDIRPGPHGSGVTSLRAATRLLCFGVDEGRPRPTSWVSDGTAPGTHRGRCPS